MSEFILDSIFYYSGVNKILKGCFLKVESGNVTGLVGRNGTGKSTLLKIASGQLKADSGITLIHGLRLHNKSKRKRYRFLSYLPQQSFIPGEVKVAKVLPELVEGDEILQSIKQVKVKELSSGERRYLEIILVLSFKRDFVILDEPFTGLSPKLIERVAEKITHRKKEGIGFLISDHYAHYMVELTDQFYLMKNGVVQKIAGDSGHRALLAEAGYFSR